MENQNIISDREKEVLLTLMQGHGKKEVADILFIDLQTVKTHVQNILNKLDCDKTATAGPMALHLKAISEEENKIAMENRLRRSKKP